VGLSCYGRKKGMCSEELQEEEEEATSNLGKMKTDKN